MSRVTIAGVAEEMYLVLHLITLESETGKPLRADLLERAQKALADADRISQFRELVYGTNSGNQPDLA